MPFTNKDDGFNQKSTDIRNVVAEFEALGDEFAETYDRFARPFYDGTTDDSDDVQVVFESVPQRLTGFSFDEYQKSHSYTPSVAPRKADSLPQAPNILDLDYFKDVTSESNFENEISLLEYSKRPKSTGNVQNKNFHLTDETVLSDKVTETRGRPRKSKRGVFINWTGLDNFSTVNVPFIRSEDCKNRKNRPLRCKLCNSEFFDVTSLCQHVLLHHQKPKQELGKADFKKDNPQEVGMKFRCGMCYPKREFDSGIQLKEHVDADHKSARLGFACVHCKENFVTVEAFQMHVLNFHDTRNRGTKLGQKSVTEQSQVPIGGTDSNFEMKPGKRTVSKQREFVCGKCGDAFKKTAALKWHIKEVHEFSRPFECTLCEARFRTESGRVEHERVAHFILEMSKCTECTATFHAEEELKVHVLEQHLDLRMQQEDPRYFDFCMNRIPIEIEDTAKTSYFLEANQFSLFGSNRIIDPTEQISRVLPYSQPEPSRKKLITVNGEKIVQLSLQKLIAVDFRILNGFTPIETARDGMITFSSTKRISADVEDFLARLEDAEPNEIPPIPRSFAAKVTVAKRAPRRTSSTRRSRVVKALLKDAISADLSVPKTGSKGQSTDSSSKTARQTHSVKRPVPVDVCKSESNANDLSNLLYSKKIRSRAAKTPKNAINFVLNVPKTSLMGLSTDLPSKTGPKKRSAKPSATFLCQTESNANDPNNLSPPNKIRKSHSVKIPLHDVMNADFDAPQGDSKGLSSESLPQVTRKKRSLKLPVTLDLCQTESKANGRRNPLSSKKSPSMKILQHNVINTGLDTCERVSKSLITEKCMNI